MALLDRNSTIYCDMDGVLCDFEGGVRKLTTKPIASMRMREMWDITRKHPQFWAELDWMNGAQQLWDLVNWHGGHILSSCAYSDPNSWPGKLQWLENKIGLVDKGRIHITENRHHKKHYAVSNETANILIDDHVSNIAQWRNAGGVGILHVSVKESLDQLRFYGY